MAEANSINAATTGIVGNTGTAFPATPVTQYNVILGGSTSSTLDQAAPSATSGVPVISQGAAVNPAFGTAVVAGGGTGATSFTAYAVLTGGTTSTNPIQAIASVGIAGEVLTSNGAGALPTFQANASGDVIGPGSSTDNALVRWDGTTGKLIQNGVITEDDTGNLSISAAVSGGSLSALVANTSNTASATAFFEAQVAGSTASDAYYRADISGGQAWTWGLDNSDSDAFVVSANTALGTTNIMRSSTAGEINYSLQPAFLAVLSAEDSNVTGDSTAFTIGSGNVFTEIFDQNSDFATTGTFTAPVTGRYLLGAEVYSKGYLSGHTRQLLVQTTSNRNYAWGYHGFNLADSAAEQIGNITNFADMDAADTYVITFTVYNSTKVIDIDEANTYMSAFLVC